MLSESRQLTVNSHSCRTWRQSSSPLLLVWSEPLLQSECLLPVVLWACLPVLSGDELKQSEVKSESLSHVQLFAALWTVAHQAPLSMEFSRQEHWSGLPFPSPGGSS